MVSEAVLREILQELKDVKTTQLRMEAKQDQMDERLNRIEQDITEMKASIKCIEKNEPQEILSLLKIMNKKIDHFAIDVEFLKEKTGKHDAEINRLNKLIQM